jgi:DNA-binding NtrC family response regulator
MERAVLLKNGITIEASDLALVSMSPQETVISAKSDAGTLLIDLSKGIVLEELERTILERILVQTGWNRARAAQLLGVSRETLRYRIEKHNLKAPNPFTEP